MRKLGYYEFEGNTVFYDGGEDAYDLDSREWIPIDLITALGEYLGEYLGEDDYSSNMPCDNTGYCDPSCSRRINGKCNGY